MTKIMTAGTSSCATFALSWFANNQGMDWKAENIRYNNLPNNRKKSMQRDCALDLQGFHDDVLYPVSQPLGETKHWPFQCIMDTLEGYFKKTMNTKLITVLLSAYQMTDGYWPSVLEENGFTLVDITNNSIGETCYLFIRNNRRPENVSLQPVLIDGEIKNPVDDEDEEEDFEF